MNKKIRNMYLTLSSLLLSYLLFFPMNVFAEGTSDAVADIMNNERFAGAISSIEWLTTRVDYWFTMVITAAVVTPPVNNMEAVPANRVNKPTPIL